MMSTSSDVYEFREAQKTYFDRGQEAATVYVESETIDWSDEDI